MHLTILLFPHISKPSRHPKSVQRQYVASTSERTTLFLRPEPAGTRHRNHLSSSFWSCCMYITDVILSFQLASATSTPKTVALIWNYMSYRDILAEEFAENVVIKRKEDFAIIVGKDFIGIKEKKLRTEKLAKVTACIYFYHYMTKTS